MEKTSAQPVAKDQPFVWAVLALNNGQPKSRLIYGDYIADVTFGYDDKWSGVVNHSGKLDLGSEEGAKAYCEEQIQARLKSRLESAQEAIRIFGALA